jgi:hypothetical protein
MNPSPLGAEATLDDCRSRFGSPWVFDRAYTLIVGNPLPAGEDHTSAAAMGALHAAVIQLPTIKACTTEILGAIEGFESGVDYHGTDGHFLQSLGYEKPLARRLRRLGLFLAKLNRLHEAFKRSQVSPPASSSSQDQQPTRPSAILSQRRLTQQLTKQWPQFKA